MTQTKVLPHVAHVNGWESAVYIQVKRVKTFVCHASNLSVVNFRIFLLVYPGSVSSSAGRRGGARMGPQPGVRRGWDGRTDGVLGITGLRRHAAWCDAATRAGAATAAEVVSSGRRPTVFVPPPTPVSDVFLDWRPPSVRAVP